MTIIPATPSTVVAQSKLAKAGDTIHLTGGVYQPFALKALVSKGEPITLTAEKGVTLTGLSLGMGCEGITMRGLNFAPVSGDKQPLPVALNIAASARRIVVEGCDFSATDGFLANGIWLRTVFDVTVRKNRFHDHYQGIYLNGSTDVLIEDNDFREMHSDCVRNGPDTTRVTIRNNYGTNSRQTGGDHLDFIQAWTTAANGPTVDLVIEGNVHERGSGDPVQGVQIGDEGRVGYDGLIVRGNVLYGAMYNGIQVSGAREPVVERNFTQAVEGFKDAKGGAIDRSSIMIRGSTGGVVRDNATNSVLLYQNVRDPSVSATKTIPLVKAGDTTWLDAWRGRSVAPVTVEDRLAALERIVAELVKKVGR